MFVTSPRPSEQPLCHAVLACLAVNGKMSTEGKHVELTMKFYLLLQNMNYSHLAKTKLSSGPLELQNHTHHLSCSTINILGYFVADVELVKSSRELR